MNVAKKGWIIDEERIKNVPDNVNNQGYSRACPPEVKAALDKLFSSPRFARAPSQGALIKYLWDCQEPAKEYQIGCDVLGRDASFDPLTDGIVRVQMVRLRARLSSYYAAEGAADPVIFEIPKGSYSVTYRYASPQTASSHQQNLLPGAPPALATDLPGSYARFRKSLPLACTFLALTGLCLAVFFSHRLNPKDKPLLVVTGFERLEPEAGTDALWFSNSVADNLGSLREVHLSRRNLFATGTKLDNQTGTVLNGSKADLVAAGTFSKSAGEIRVSAQLLDGKSGYEIWSQSFAGAAIDKQFMPREVANAIASQVKLLHSHHFFDKP